VSDADPEALAAQQLSAEELRALHRSPDPLVLLNAWDVASARVFARAGASAIATTSAGIAAALGYPDGQQITVTEMASMIKRIARAVDLPVTADLEAGYGDSAEAAGRSATVALQAGAVGVNIEDTTDSQPGPLLDTERQSQKIEAVRAAGVEFGVALVINARTDIFLAQVGEPKDRVEHTASRASAYLGAGADCIFVPGVSDRETIAQLVEAIGGPVNVLAGADTPSVRELRELGVARVSVGSGPMRATLALAGRIAEELLRHGTYGAFKDALPYPDLLELLR
jgi:2-methylisocitrate lyase-like PEP mutase family enzyme